MEKLEKGYTQKELHHFMQKAFQSGKKFRRDGNGGWETYEIEKLHENTKIKQEDKSKVQQEDKQIVQQEEQEEKPKKQKKSLWKKLFKL